LVLAGLDRRHGDYRGDPDDRHDDDELDEREAARRARAACVTSRC
jgi:hypothetical protein